LDTNITGFPLIDTVDILYDIEGSIFNFDIGFCVVPIFSFKLEDLGFNLIKGKDSEFMSTHSTFKITT